MKKLILFGLLSISLVASDGSALFKRCAACHGAKAEKHALGKSKVIAGWPKEKIVEALKEYKSGTRNVHGMGSLMKGQVAFLTDKDIDAIADYISKLK